MKITVGAIDQHDEKLDISVCKREKLKEKWSPREYLSHMITSTTKNLVFFAINFD
jgi:hypothetical protein